MPTNAELERQLARALASEAALLDEKATWLSRTHRAETEAQEKARELNRATQGFNEMDQRLHHANLANEEYRHNLLEANGAILEGAVRFNENQDTLRELRDDSKDLRDKMEVLSRVAEMLRDDHEHCDKYADWLKEKLVDCRREQRRYINRINSLNKHVARLRGEDEEKAATLSHETFEVGEDEKETMLKAEDFMARYN